MLGLFWISRMQNEIKNRDENRSQKPSSCCRPDFADVEFPDLTAMEEMQEIQEAIAQFQNYSSTILEFVDLFTPEYFKLNFQATDRATFIFHSDRPS